MFGEGLENDVRQGNRPNAARGLGRPERRRLAPDPDELAVNSGAAAQEVHPVEGGAEDLALSESGARSEDDHCVVALGDGLGQDWMSDVAMGATGFLTILGSRIPSQGDRAMRRSREAALKIVATYR